MFLSGLQPVKVIIEAPNTVHTALDRGAAHTTSVAAVDGLPTVQTCLQALPMATLHGPTTERNGDVVLPGDQ